MAAILCIETSYQFCSVAVQIGDKIFSKESLNAHKHSELISSLISSCLEEAGILIGELQAVAISDGPGSYTGLRIGASTAKGICFGLDIPLIAVSTLESLANAVINTNKEHSGLIWPMIDARRMEVYHCLYNHVLEPVSEVSSGIISNKGFCPDIVSDDTILCGDGAEKAIEILKLPYMSIVQHAKLLCPLAIKIYSGQKFADINSYQPFYLKQANITTSLAK